jgi:hypothetical protein
MLDACVTYFCDPKDEGNMFLLNAGELSPDYTVSHLRS